MKIDKIIQNLKQDTIISKKEYEDILSRLNQKYSERTIYWKMAKFQDMGALQKIGQNSFIVVDTTKK